MKTDHGLRTSGGDAGGPIGFGGRQPKPRALIVLLLMAAGVIASLTGPLRS